jgi:hypothetical protein
MNDIDVKELKRKILEGVALAYRKLVEQKKKEDGELVFSVNGKIVVVKARDLQDDYSLPASPRTKKSE